MINLSGGTVLFAMGLTLLGAGGLAAGALGAAALAPAVSLGPAFDLEALRHTPWRRGRRLVDEQGKLLVQDLVRQAR